MPYRYTQQECVVCGKVFKAARRDSFTCSVACQAKLSRERRRLANERAAQRLDAHHIDLLKRLQVSAPEAFNELRRLDALYGRTATQHALAAIQATLVRYHQQLQAANSKSPRQP